VFFAQQNAHRRWKIIFGKTYVWWRISLGFGSGFTDISVAPSAIYNFNEYVAWGGLQYKYLKRNFSSHLYGGSVIAFNP
jgi:hypothetical protein